MKLLVLVALLLTTQFCRAQNTEALNYIKANAVTIDTANHIDLPEDIPGFNEAFKGKQIIGMGEATHGTHKFQLAKFKGFKYLVKQNAL